MLNHFKAFNETFVVKNVWSPRIVFALVVAAARVVMGAVAVVVVVVVVDERIWKAKKHSTQNRLLTTKTITG